jgi:3-deoxy-manno-octulosonate cytidylyltransferase (CMP-KDO synthetase)
MSFVVIIPARYSSTRLPGKPLLDVSGKSMIQRVWEQAVKSAASRVIIATDDQRIGNAARQFGAEVCMTRDDHTSGTDRLAEVVDWAGFGSDQIVVNVQGDEPLIPPQVIDQVADNLVRCADAGVATLCEPITDISEFHNPNVVKVVFDRYGLACYFSRAPIPWPRDGFENDKCCASRHIGIYAYRVQQLRAFVDWPVAPMEKQESLEQLRFLFNSVQIHVSESIAKVPGGVDTQDDLDAVNALLHLTKSVT